MAFVAFPDCVRAEIRMSTTAGKPMEITLWGRKIAGSVDQDDVSNLATDLDTWAVNELIPLLNTSTNYVETYTRDMTQAISFQGLATAGAGAGTAAGTAIEDHSCVLAMRKSGLVGRSASGRVYVPGGVTASRVNPSRWNTGYTGNVVAALEASNDVFDGQGFLPIIASPTLMTDTGQVLLSTFAIFSWTVSLDIATIRERSRAP